MSCCIQCFGNYIHSAHLCCISLFTNLSTLKQQEYIQRLCPLEITMLHTLQRTLISNFIYFTSIANRIFNSVLDFEIRFTKGILHTMLKAVSKDQTHDEVINQTFKLHTDKILFLFMILNSHQMSSNFLLWLMLGVFAMATTIRMYAIGQQFKLKHRHLLPRPVVSWSYMWILYGFTFIIPFKGPDPNGILRADLWVRLCLGHEVDSHVPRRGFT